MGNFVCRFTLQGFPSQEALTDKDFTFEVPHVDGSPGHVRKVTRMNICSLET